MCAEERGSPAQVRLLTLLENLQARATLTYRSSMDDSTAQSVLAKSLNASMNLMAARSKRPGRIPFARMRAGPCIPTEHAA